MDVWPGPWKWTPFQLLSTGVYEVEKGVFVNFTEADLERMAGAYNTFNRAPILPFALDYARRAVDGTLTVDDVRRENPSAKISPSAGIPRFAPVVIGHPENDMPLYGFISFLGVHGNQLFGFAEHTALSDSFLRELRDGKSPRYAAQFFAPENPNNPVSGSWFLKHVGFMGPPPPIVRGTFNGVLSSDAQYMESLSGGKVIEPAMRFGEKAGLAGSLEFIMFATVPTDASDIAARAQALQCAFSERGHLINTAEAVAHVLSSAQGR